MKRFFLFVFFLFFVAPAAADDLPRLRVEGNKILQNGKPVTLRGVSLCSLEWHRPLSLINQITTTDPWKANILRLPVQAREWRRVGPQAYIKGYLDPAVKLCGEKNIYCIIDWHEIAPWNDPAKQKDLIEFWKHVAPRYATRQNIIYELFNEPTEPKAKTEKNWLAWRAAAQKWVNQIKKDAPHTLLLIGSPHWSQMPSFAAKHPFKGKNLAYTLHLYPNYKPQSWDALFGEASKKIPIIITEWGWSEGTPKPGGFDLLYSTKEKYAQPLRDYLDARPHIHWTAWSYDPKCGPAMLGPDTAMAAFVKKWLAEENP